MTYCQPWVSNASLQDPFYKGFKSSKLKSWENSFCYNSYSYDPIRPIFFTWHNDRKPVMTCQIVTIFHVRATSVFARFVLCACIFLCNRPLTFVTLMVREWRSPHHGGGGIHLRCQMAVCEEWLGEEGDKSLLSGFNEINLCTGTSLGSYCHRMPLDLITFLISIASAVVGIWNFALNLKKNSTV